MGGQRVGMHGVRPQAPGTVDPGGGDLDADWVGERNRNRWGGLARGMGWGLRGQSIASRLETRTPRGIHERQKSPPGGGSHLAGCCGRRLLNRDHQGQTNMREDEGGQRERELVGVAPQAGRLGVISTSCARRSRRGGDGRPRSQRKSAPAMATAAGSAPPGTTATGRGAGARAPAPSSCRYRSSARAATSRPCSSPDDAPSARCCRSSGRRTSKASRPAASTTSCARSAARASPRARSRGSAPSSTASWRASFAVFVEEARAGHSVRGAGNRTKSPAGAR